MSENPKGAGDVPPEKAEQGGNGQDHSPAPSRDHERDETGAKKQPGGKTDEIEGAQADEDTYD